MATPAAEGSTACAASASWLCGVIAGLADTELLFSRSPWIGFVLVAAIGGFIGWCILLERGDFDDEPRSTVARRLVSRVSIGGAVGAATSMVWYAYEGESRGMPMLIAGLIAVFPLESYKMGWRKVKRLIVELAK